MDLFINKHLKDNFMLNLLIELINEFKAQRGIDPVKIVVDYRTFKEILAEASNDFNLPELKESRSCLIQGIETTYEASSDNGLFIRIKT